MSAPVRTTDEYADRVAIGNPWEAEVADALFCRGFTVQRVGTGQLNAVMRALLQAYRTPDGRRTTLRWGADICAAKRDEINSRIIAYLIDAKAGDKWRTSGNHDVELNALDGAEDAQRIWGIPAAFVFQDWTVASPATIRRSITRQLPGVAPGRTDFAIFPRIVCTPFDDVFGASVYKDGSA